MYNRKIADKILAEFDTHEIVFLLGTRQTGKTTLTKIISQKSSYSKKDTYFFDFEDKEYRELFSDVTISKLEQIFTLEEMDTDKKLLVIFDEIQLLEDPSNLLKLLHDHFKNLKIIATGSSSLQIKMKFSDSLAGRKKVYNIQPLNFDEFLLFKREDKLLKIREMFRNQEDKNSLISIVDTYKKQFLLHFEEYLIYGGYPEVVLINKRENKIAKLDSIASAYIQKDIREIANIENITAYNNLIKYLAINIGKTINISSLTNSIGISTQTSLRYINLLQETFIIKELAPFFTNKNKEISKNKKIFFKDLGVRNLQIKNFNDPTYRTDLGEIYENYIFNLFDNQNSILETLYFYRTQSKTEIDFVNVKQNKTVLYEVKSGDYRKKPKAMVEFENRYKDRQIEKFVINRSILDLKDGIWFVPAFLV
jgi:predicted AAA+ superfamily ATPase